MLWLVCYDIENDRTRLRVARTLLRYGERVQNSVYECHLTVREMLSVKREIELLTQRCTDRVRFYPQCKRDRSSIVVDGHGVAVTVDFSFRIV